MPNRKQIPVEIVGSSVFGRYNKINDQKTYNMFESDGWLVNYAGYRQIGQPTTGGEGRAIFHSTRNEFMIAVVGAAVFKITAALGFVPIGVLETAVGEVTIDENLSGQICIVDGAFAYIYHIPTNTFTKQTLNFAPNYVTYHASAFLLASAPSTTNPQLWYAFIRDTDSTIKENPVGGQFAIQTKPDKAIAVTRIPSGGNNVLVFGNSVAEIWTKVGGADNYRRVSSVNIDYGCASVHTIAANDKYVFWLAINELSQPVIMFSDGKSFQDVSTSGIDYLLSTIQHPNESTAFFYKQDGNLFYHLTFYNPEDNLSLFYHVEQGKFYNATDECMNYHIARQIVNFNNRVFFVSLNDSYLYEMSTRFVDYNSEYIPRLRICNTIRQPDSSRFRVGEFGFWIEQGFDRDYKFDTQTNNIPRVDLSFSKNGGESYSNNVGVDLNVSGKYKNRVTVHRLGAANEFTMQLRFWGMQRFVVNNGYVEVY